VAPALASVAIGLTLELILGGVPTEFRGVQGCWVESHRGLHEVNCTALRVETICFKVGWAYIPLVILYWISMGARALFRRVRGKP